MPAALMILGIRSTHHAAASPAVIDYVGVVLILLGMGAVGICFVARSAGRMGLDGDDSADGGGGGRGPECDPTPPPRLPDMDPEWWPEFERGFALDVESRLALSR
jgi:hypothetical protein